VQAEQRQSGQCRAWPVLPEAALEGPMQLKAQHRDQQPIPCHELETRASLSSEGLSSGDSHLSACAPPALLLPTASIGSMEDKIKVVESEGPPEAQSLCTLALAAHMCCLRDFGQGQALAGDF